MPFDYHAIVIGTGFGANVVASDLAARHPNTGGKPPILMLERGVWWFSPERPFPPPFAANYDAKYPPGDGTLDPYQKHPVKYWPRPDHRRGVLELLEATWANVIGGDRRKLGDDDITQFHLRTVLGHRCAHVARSHTRNLRTFCCRHLRSPDWIS